MVPGITQKYVKCTNNSPGTKKMRMELHLASDQSIQPFHFQQSYISVELTPKPDLSCQFILSSMWCNIFPSLRNIKKKGMKMLVLQDQMGSDQGLVEQEKDK